MLQLLFAFTDRPDFWQLAAIPLVATLIGVAGNWLAVQMTFGPTRFVGFGGIGWQGIVPGKAERLAGLLVEHTLGRLTSLYELFLSLEPEKLTRHVIRTVNSRIEDFVEEVVGESNSVLWENLPVLVKARVYARVRRQLPEILDNVIEDLAQNIEELVDLKQMVVRRMAEDSSPLVHLFRACGARELRLAPVLGGIFGLAFGLVQMLAYMVHPEPWVLLVLALAGGYLSIWLTHSLMFRPREPIRFGPFTLHGLFLRRKAEVAARFCEVSVQEIINLRCLMLEMLNGARSDRTRAIIRRRVRPLLDNGVVRTAVQLTIGAEGYASLRHVMAEKAVAMALEPLSDPGFSVERSGGIGAVVLPRLRAMSNADFQEVLLMVFQEDEWRLLLTGALLGVASGWLEWLFLLGGH
jgi:uncharacterized membrane protein YheB (UPF0754 family)